MDHNKLCERVFALNEDIRYAGVIDSTGTLVAGGMRKGTDSIVSETDEELFLTHTALRKSMRDRFDTLSAKRCPYLRFTWETRYYSSHLSQTSTHTQQ